MWSSHSPLRPRWPRRTACSAICAGWGTTFTGVPCSLLIPLYQALEEAGQAYFPATREDLALGLAAGAALAGGGRRS